MRLFIAMELSGDVRATLADVQSALTARSDGVRWIPPDQLHLTVKFLGEVADGDVDTVSEAVAMAAAEAEPFTMKMVGCGCFPPHGPVRIIWAGVREPAGALLTCVETVEEALEPWGFPRERRPFSEHVTIGRVRQDRSNGRLRTTVNGFSFRSIEQAVSSLTVMRSALSPKGPVYTVVSTVKLEKGGSTSQ